MRQIVACTECRRQYDAGQAQPGARFRCHCGAEIIVRQPQGHSAAVVRCSSCGAPRVGRAEACQHCGADFTIHERDLHTVCPTCLARVSDRARYCHHCATPLMPELVVSDRTEHHCPVCGPERLLVSRRLTQEQITVLECEVCGGLWLGLETFRTLLDQQSFSSRPAAANLPPCEPQRGPRYRSCVVCGALMIQRNLGRGGSGVIVDLCGSHGLWFDADELSQLLAWIRSGGADAIRREVEHLRGANNATRRRQALARKEPWQPAEHASPAPFQEFAPPEDDLLGDLAAAGLNLLSRIFRRT